MMHISDRRNFLTQLGSVGAALAASSWLTGFGFAQGQARGPARAIVDQARTRATIDRRLLGAFLEHLGRAIYTGVYDPGNPLSDERGFRKDVIAEIKQILSRYENEVPPKAAEYAALYNADDDVRFWLLTLDYGIEKMRFDLQWAERALAIYAPAKADLESEE